MSSLPGCLIGSSVVEFVRILFQLLFVFVLFIVCFRLFIVLFVFCFSLFFVLFVLCLRLLVVLFVLVFLGLFRHLLALELFGSLFVFFGLLVLFVLVLDRLFIYFFIRCGRTLLSIASEEATHIPNVIDIFLIHQKITLPLARLRGFALCRLRLLNLRLGRCLLSLLLRLLRFRLSCLTSCLLRRCLTGTARCSLCLSLCTRCCFRLCLCTCCFLLRTLCCSAGCDRLLRSNTLHLLFRHLRNLISEETIQSI